MINKIIEKLSQYSNIAILGFGREGKTTYEFIRKYNKDIKLTIIDKAENIKENTPELAQDPNLSFVMGPTYLDNLEQYDLIIKSPGISLLNIDTTNLKDKLTSQLELVLEVNKKNIIGITGTKGKSTTASLIYKIIKDQNDNVILAGNIGIPILAELEHCNDETILVKNQSRTIVVDECEFNGDKVTVKFNNKLRITVKYLIEDEEVSESKTFWAPDDEIVLQKIEGEWKIVYSNLQDSGSTYFSD